MNTQKNFISKILIYTILASAITGLIFLIVDSQNEYNWEQGKTDFSIFYSSVGTYADGEINIKISKNGKYEFIEYDNISKNDNKKIARQYTTTLTNSEMENLFNHMINKARFFKLKQNLYTEKVMDASYDYLEVNFNGNSHRIGGYAASFNKDFKKASKEFHKLNVKLIKELEAN